MGQKNILLFSDYINAIYNVPLPLHPLLDHYYSSKEFGGLRTRIRCDRVLEITSDISLNNASVAVKS